MNNCENTNSIEKDTENDQSINNSSSLEKDNKSDIQIKMDTENYNFGWSKYSEITNGRFAMIGFVAIILIELISHKSFLSWAGFLN